MNASAERPASKATLVLITLLLGGLGLHHFYLRRYFLASLYLLFWWTLIPMVASLVEVVLYLRSSEAELQARHPDTQPLPGLVIAAVVFVILSLVVAVVAMLALVVGYSAVTGIPLEQIQQQLEQLRQLLRARA